MSSSLYGTCWSCGCLFKTHVFFCSVCSTVQPPAQGSAFEKLGIDVSFDICLTELEKRYYAQQAMLHPDKFVTKSEVEKLYALQQSSDLNTAYAVLRNPIKRGAHLLTLYGEEDILVDKTLHDTDLLTEIMHQQEALESANSQPEVEALHNKINEKISQSERAISNAFQTRDFDQAKKSMHQLAYLSTLLEQCVAKAKRFKEN